MRVEENLIYLVSHVLQDPESWYQKLEKMALVVLITTKKLRHYFLSFLIIVWMDQPIQKILQKSNLAGRMMKWVVELSEYDIVLEKKGVVKSQVLTDFMVELTQPLMCHHFLLFSKPFLHHFNY